MFIKIIIIIMNAEQPVSINQYPIKLITLKLRFAMRNLAPTNCIASPTSSSLANAVCVCVDSDGGHLCVRAVAKGRVEFSVVSTRMKTTRYRQE